MTTVTTRATTRPSLFRILLIHVVFTVNKEKEKYILIAAPEEPSKGAVKCERNIISRDGISYRFVFQLLSQHGGKSFTGVSYAVVAESLSAVVFRKKNFTV